MGWEVPFHVKRPLYIEVCTKEDRIEVGPPTVVQRHRPRFIKKVTFSMTRGGRVTFRRRFGGVRPRAVADGSYIRGAKVDYGDLVPMGHHEIHGTYVQAYRQIYVRY